MKKLCVFVMAGFLLLAWGVGVSAQEKKAAPEKTAPATQKPKVVEQRLVSVTATVEAIDLANRVVTLKGPQGNVVDLKVDEKVKNLPQVKVGDQVVARHYESIAVQVMKAGAAGGVAATEAVATAKPGERPAGVAASQVTVTTTIESIDPKKTSVTLKGPRGRIVAVKVRDPKNLENVKVGDQVVITYTEALAISVEPAKKK